MTNPERPLSPHLSIYRWPISMTLSILHRMTGVALSAGLIVLVVWLESIAFGPAAYGTVMDWMASPLGKLLLLGWTFAFFFHLCNGVRHLFWDVGMGFEIAQTNASAWTVVIVSLLLTTVFWLTLGGGLL